jgi:hypothetical protein
MTCKNHFPFDFLKNDPEKSKSAELLRIDFPASYFLMSRRVLNRRIMST